MNWERTPVYELQVNIYILRLRTVDIQLRLFPVSRVRAVRTCHSYHHQWYSKLGYWGRPPIHIFVFTYHQNNRFRKKLIVQNMNM